MEKILLVVKARIGVGVSSAEGGNKKELCSDSTVENLDLDGSYTRILSC